MEKRIKDYEDYAITEDGIVISYKYKVPRKMKTWYQKAGYENIKLCKNNKTKHFLVHRLVAEAFIPNPDNLPEVNHKNKDRQDNRVANLEWCTRLDNLKDSYETMSPIRNFCTCRLINPQGEEVDQFQSISEASRYAVQFGCSYSGMVKYYTSNGYSVIKN